MGQDLAFDLTLTEEQRITRESVRRFAEKRLRESARPADEDGATPAALLEETVELGISLLAIPETAGGAGMPRSPIANVLTAEDLAWGDMSLALAALTPLAFINAVVDFGDADQQERFLSPLAAETFVPATVALMEGKATFEPSQLATKARKSGDGYVIDGEKRLVPLGASAGQILVIAELEGEGPAAFVVEQGAQGLSSEAEQYMGLRAVETATLTLEGVAVDADARLANFDLQRLVDLSRIGACALATGCAQAVLDYVTPWCNDRKAFGEPISHRQSVAFMVADMAIELEAMRLLTWRAASRAEQGLDCHREAYLAYMLCSEKAMKIGTDGVQLMGGHGFTRDYPVELWYRNLRALGILEGVAMV
jgi:alkylation response protein AidB-like acyl-CoA dehydrogenase